MSVIRVTLISRRFWPLVGGAEVIMGNLASQLQRLHCRSRLLTAQWDPSWPVEMVHLDVPVLRLPQPARRGWGTLRYMRGLARWLRDHRDEMDAVCVSMLKHDAYAAISALADTTIPVVLRAEGGGETGDCHWQQTARLGRRIQVKCRAAPAVVAVSDSIATELKEAGYAESRVHYIPNGVAVAPRVPSRKTGNVRRALADVNPDLHVLPGAPVAVYTGRLHPGKGLRDLVHAWKTVAAQLPEARLWLIGDGPDRDHLHQEVRDAELVGRVLMPGSFDSVDELLHAADVFVLPSYAEGLSLSLLEAMAAGVPVIATDIPGNRTLVEDGQTGRLVPPHDPPALAAAVLDSFSRPAGLETMVQRAHARVRERYSLHRMAKDHLELFQRLRGEA